MREMLEASSKHLLDVMTQHDTHACEAQPAF